MLGEGGRQGSNQWRHYTTVHRTPGKKDGGPRFRNRCASSRRTPIRYTMWRRIRVEGQHEPPQTCVNTDRLNIDRSADGFHKHGLQQKGYVIGLLVDNLRSGKGGWRWYHPEQTPRPLANPLSTMMPPVFSYSTCPAVFPRVLSRLTSEHDDKTSLSQPKGTLAIH